MQLQFRAVLIEDEASGSGRLYVNNEGPRLWPVGSGEPEKVVKMLVANGVTCRSVPVSVEADESEIPF